MFAVLAESSGDPWTLAQTTDSPEFFRVDERPPSSDFVDLGMEEGSRACKYMWDGSTECGPGQWVLYEIFVVTQKVGPLYLLEGGDAIPALASHPIGVEDTFKGSGEPLEMSLVAFWTQLSPAQRTSDEEYKRCGKVVTFVMGHGSRIPEPQRQGKIGTPEIKAWCTPLMQGPGVPDYLQELQVLRTKLKPCYCQNHWEPGIQVLGERNIG